MFVSTGTGAFWFYRVSCILLTSYLLLTRTSLAEERLVTKRRQ